MRPRHTARGIVLHDDQLLLIERWRDDLHYFSIPGCGIESGEQTAQTVVREIIEETGCQVVCDRLLYVLESGEGSLHFFYLCNYQSGDPHLPANSPEALENDPHNIFRPIWLPLDQLANSPFLVWEPVRQQLLHDLEKGFQKTVVKLHTDMLR